MTRANIKTLAVIKSTSLVVLLWLTLTTAGFSADVEFLGRASCATSTCHGGVEGRGPVWNHSLSTWLAKDPHAGAGLLLLDDDSRQIVKRLAGLPMDGTLSEEEFASIARTRCISCHATPTPQECEPSGSLDATLLAEGVSCEACHGAAEHWLEPHVQGDWTGPQRFEPETGMLDTESIIGRAENCVRCHIGSRTDDGLVRDMNHDLIAAGHPALRFDLLLYNENLPKHWDEASEVEVEFNRSAVRVRSVGRAINLAAAASLSAERATDHLADSSVPWPELADYDCFACHQSLSMREYQLPPTDKAKSPLHVSDGLPIWNAWHTINQLDLRDDRSTLEALSPHRSDPNRIAKSAPRLVSRYRDLATAKMSEKVSPWQALQTPRDQLESEPPIDWHQAAIQYLEFDAALRDMVRDAEMAESGKRYLEAFQKVEQMLRFDGSASGRVHSPAGFDPDAFRETVLGILPNQVPTDAP